MHLSRETGNFTIAPVVFLVFIPIIAGFVFSPLGFNPTDDGFTLAYSRRIIEGQIPHRDFIIIRPFLSPLLHTPFVLLGGEYTYLISRVFVWFQFSFIAWFWVIFVEKKIKEVVFGGLERIFIALVSFVASVHSFPIMAWHTIDGLFLIVMGLSLFLVEKRVFVMLGYFLIGMAYLCKQSFLFVAPLTLIIMGDWRKLHYWLAIVTPGILYITFLLFTRALQDAILQLSTQTNIFSAGLITYFNIYTLLGCIVGYISCRLYTQEESLSGVLWKNQLRIFALSVVLLIGLLITFAVAPFPVLSFVLFGLVVGFFGQNLRKNKTEAKIVFTSLLMAWSASLSIGYNTPVLASGQLLTVLLVFVYSKIADNLRLYRNIYIFGLFSMCFVISVLFGLFRANYIYREQEASNLVKRLDEVLPGGRYIRTNENTYKFLVDLQNAISIAQDLGMTYSIVPDCAGWWVKSPQTNPISIDWAQGTELGKPELNERVIRELESIRHNNIVIVQKVEANDLSNGFTPLGDQYVVVEYIKNHFVKVYETSFFELYR